MVALHIPEGSSYWLCSADLGQCHVQGGDVRGEAKKPCGGGRHCVGGMNDKEGRDRVRSFIHSEQPDPVSLLVGYFPEMAH